MDTTLHTLRVEAAKTEVHLVCSCGEFRVDLGIQADLWEIQDLAAAHKANLRPTFTAPRDAIDVVTRERSGSYLGQYLLRQEALASARLDSGDGQTFAVDGALDAHLGPQESA